MSELATIYPYLAHYTSLEAVKGIVESRCLHSTNYKLLNDSEEIFFLKKHLPEALRMADVTKENPSTYTDRLYRFYEDQLTMATYIISFCGINLDPNTHPILEHGVLSQWRSYTKANGNGYAIIFNTNALENAYNLRGNIFKSGSEIGKVCYANSPNDVYSSFKSELEQIRSALLSATLSDTKDDTNLINSVLGFVDIHNE